MVQLYGQIKTIDGTTKWKPIEAVLQPDGSYAIKVDTELVLDGASVSISNLKVGSLNQTSNALRYLKTRDDGTVVVEIVGGDPLENYKVVRSQDTGAYPYYFGLTDESENWVIIEESKNLNVSSFKYFAGTGNFQTGWTARAGLAYDEYFNIF